ncbi:COMM domain-containing protein 6 [Ophiophagus hannah]|uniref:COMM domain-containing protein 6 n=1 Tax=Ophiophagus hannah TaxID=8665 RepID=V8N522_OPHHA|nr:COMM domain-containing protein 6 [Ophiophagus hannah]
MLKSPCLCARTGRSTFDGQKRTERWSRLTTETSHVHPLPLQLIDFQWKLGIAVSADSCKSLKSPCVTVALKVADGLGNVTCKTFEMTIAQFQVGKRPFLVFALLEKRASSSALTGCKQPVISILLETR